MGGHVLEECKYEDIIDDPKYFKDLLLEHKLLCFRELNLTKNQHLKIIKALGYYKFGQHIEDHRLTIEGNFGERKNTPLELLVPWHQESLHQKYPPCVAGWNMELFTCPKDHGRTGFVDMVEAVKGLSAEVVANLENTEYIVVRSFDDIEEATEQIKSGSREISILNKSGQAERGGLADPSDDRRSDYYFPSIRQAIEKHPLTDELVIRYEIDWSPSGNGAGTCITFTSAERRIEVDELVKGLYLNPDNQFWWEWTQGDFLLADLVVMGHAVTGGFLPTERLLDVTFNTIKRINNQYGPL
tara:strand:- start:669 stop:1568 length:900 start_codon:yes stop_codon:yes gene_type:complete